MRVLDIFNSIQGEGSNMGKPTTFVRLAGCNLSCSYCDTQKEMEKKSKIMSVDEVIGSVLEISHNIRNVCITGGEPLLQKLEVYELSKELAFGYNNFSPGKNVEIETNGSVPVIPFSPIYRIRHIMDVKTPSSGCCEENNYLNLAKLASNDDLVFVIKDGVDFEFAMTLLRERKDEINAQVFFSECITEDNPRNHGYLAKMIMNNVNLYSQLKDVKVQIQLHKLCDMK